jgi:dethiobiotin synthetase
VKKNFFVTGTDTGVGKTTVACALAAYCSTVKGLDVGVMKPFEPGLSLYGKDRLPWDAISLKEASGSPDDVAIINPYAFDAALPPGAAAEIEHVRIDLEHLDRVYSRLSNSHDILFIEGAGGVLSPIGRNFFFADLMKRWGTAVIVVARLGIGTVNHTLLTCRFLSDRGIQVAGVILNDLTGKVDAATRTNREVLSRYLDVPILGVFPHLQQTETMDRNSLAQAVEKRIDTSPFVG